jgi:hypothetical protein
LQRSQGYSSFAEVEKMPPYIILDYIGKVDLDIIAGRISGAFTKPNQPTQLNHTSMFPLNTTVLAIACGNHQPYNRTGIEAIGVKATTPALAAKDQYSAASYPSRNRSCLTRHGLFLQRLTYFATLSHSWHRWTFRSWHRWFSLMS